MLNATPHTEMLLNARARWQRAALALVVPAFAVLWTGGILSNWVSGGRGQDGWLASLFLFLAGLIVLLGTRTRPFALTLACVAALGFAVEAIGVRSGIPFGEYVYTGVLQPQLLDVPLVMGLAWMALVASATDLAGRLRLGAWPAAACAALWTTASDLIIDPLATNHFGYWTWAREGSYYGIPFTNFVGWFVTGLVACRIAGLRRQPNFWAGFVGAAILLFFASISLAHGMLPVALIGFVLCAFQLLILIRTDAS